MSIEHSLKRSRAKHLDISEYPSLDLDFRDWYLNFQNANHLDSYFPRTDKTSSLLRPRCPNQTKILQYANPKIRRLRRTQFSAETSDQSSVVNLIRTLSLSTHLSLLPSPLLLLSLLLLLPPLQPPPKLQPIIPFLITTLLLLLLLFSSPQYRSLLLSKLPSKLPLLSLLTCALLGLLTPSSRYPPLLLTLLRLLLELPSEGEPDPEYDEESSHPGRQSTLLPSKQHFQTNASNTASPRNEPNTAPITTPLLSVVVFAGAGATVWMMVGAGVVSVGAVGGGKLVNVPRVTVEV